MEYRTRKKVRYPLADCAGIMFFGNAFTAAHEVVEDFILDVGFSWPEWFDREDWGTPYRHVEADYVKPVLPGIEVTARLVVTRLGESSVGWRVRFEDDSGALLCEIRLIAATVDRRTMTKRALPAIVHERLSPYLESA